MRQRLPVVFSRHSNHDFATRSQIDTENGPTRAFAGATLATSRDRVAHNRSQSRPTERPKFRPSVERGALLHSRATVTLTFSTSPQGLPLCSLRELPGRAVPVQDAGPISHLWVYAGGAAVPVPGTVNLTVNLTVVTS